MIRDLAAELPLFGNLIKTPTTDAPKGPTPVDRALDRVTPDEMTPRAALDFVYELKRLWEDNADE